MKEYSIFDHELGFAKERRAPGIAELMLDYLPWPTLDIAVKWQPSNGKVEVTDNQTEFKYTITIL